MSGSLPQARAVTISPFTPGQETALAQIYHRAVSALAGSCYSQAQCRAWSPNVRDKRFWRARLSRSLVLVALDEGNPVGFIDCELGYHSRGYIGYCYVAPDYQRRGIGRQLLARLIQLAPGYGVRCLTADASKASRGLFMASGFEDKGRQYQQKSGEVFEGFAMAMRLPFFVDDANAADLGGIAQVFHSAVQGAGEYYSEAQCHAWSPQLRDEQEWAVRLSGSRIWVARATQTPERILGFINLIPGLNGSCDGEGEIDCLFSDPSVQRMGVASALYCALEREARRRALRGLRVHASYFARPFFLARGYTEVCQNHHPRRGEVLVNFTLRKAFARAVVTPDG